MTGKAWVLAAMVTGSVIGFAAPASAAPLGPLTKPVAAGDALLDNVTYRHRNCYWNHGRRYCSYPRYSYRSYSPYRYGLSTPGFSFYIGPRRHHYGYGSYGHRRWW